MTVTMQTATGRYQVDARHTVKRQDRLVWLVVSENGTWTTYLCAERGYGYEWLGFRCAGKIWPTEPEALAYAHAV